MADGTQVGHNELLTQYFEEELKFVLSATTDAEDLDRGVVQELVLEQADTLLDDLSIENAQNVVRWMAWFVRFNTSKMTADDRFWVQNTAYNIGTEHGTGLDEAKSIWAGVNGTDELPWSDLAVRQRTEY